MLPGSMHSPAVSARAPPRQPGAQSLAAAPLHLEPPFPQPEQCARPPGWARGRRLLRQAVQFAIPITIIQALSRQLPIHLVVSTHLRPPSYIAERIEPDRRLRKVPLGRSMRDTAFRRPALGGERLSILETGLHPVMPAARRVENGSDTFSWLLPTIHEQRPPIVTNRRRSQENSRLCSRLPGHAIVRPGFPTRGRVRAGTKQLPLEPQPPCSRMERRSA